jgi:hypothetical protein
MLYLEEIGYEGVEHTDGSEYCPMAGYCEGSNEPSGS